MKSITGKEIEIDPVKALGGSTHMIPFCDKCGSDEVEQLPNKEWVCYECKNRETTPTTVTKHPVTRLELF